MSDLESIRPGEEGEETESPSLENEKSQELDKATHEPGARIDPTQSHEEAEEIESTFTELVSATTDEAESSEVPSDPDLESTEDKSVDEISEPATEETSPLPPEIPEGDVDVLPHTAVGKGPVPGFPPKLEDGQTEITPESSQQHSEAVVDVLVKVLSDSQYREQFFSNPQEALTEYKLTPEEKSALESLEEQRITEFASEFEERDLGFIPPDVPLQLTDEEQVNRLQVLKDELSDEDIKRLMEDN